MIHDSFRVTHITIVPAVPKGKMFCTPSNMVRNHSLIVFRLTWLLSLRRLPPECSIKRSCTTFLNFFFKNDTATVNSTVVFLKNSTSATNGKIVDSDCKYKRGSRLDNEILT